MEIRKAVREDCKAILELVKELALYEKAPQEVTVTEAHFTESGFGENPVWFGLVAEEENQIAGFALCYIRFSTWKGKVVYLEDFYVKEECRGKGTGALLFDALIKYCKENSYSRMQWQVLNWNEPAINFYRKYNTRFDDEWLNGILEIDKIKI
jgi:GNAT superfamily N-acetyltransferase